MLSGKEISATSSTWSPLDVQRKLDVLASQQHQMDADMYSRSCWETITEYTGAQLNATLKRLKPGDSTVITESLSYGQVLSQVDTMCTLANRSKLHLLIQSKNQLEGIQSKGLSSWRHLMSNLMLQVIAKSKYPWRFGNLQTSENVRQSLQKLSLPSTLSWTDETHSYFNFNIEPFLLADDEVSSIGSSTVSSFFSSERSRSPPFRYAEQSWSMPGSPLAVRLLDFDD